MFKLQGICIGLLFASFLTQACGTASSPTPSHFTIGVINLSPQLEPVLDGFKSGLTALGYTEIDRVDYIYNGPAPDLASLDTLARELVDKRVNLILAISTPAAQAAFHATSGTTIPVVFGPVTDPISAGIVNDLSHPGGNLTGVMLGSQSESQRFQWLTQLTPNAKRIYLPYNPEDASANASVKGAMDAAAQLNVEVVLREARTPEEITEAIEDIPEDVQAVFLPQDSLVAARIDDFVQKTLQQKLPLCVPTNGQVEHGALLSYSFRLNALGEQQARLADQIFRGTPPADLPIEIAEFFLTLNLKTADQIGITIPDTVLRAADDVIR